MLLCNVGGVLGVAVGFGLGNLVVLFTDFAVNIPLDRAVRGPAIKASRLAPIEALRYE